MGIFQGISNRMHMKRMEKATQKSEHHSHRTEYLLSNKSPFDVTEAFRNLKASISVSVPSTKVISTGT